LVINISLSANKQAENKGGNLQTLSDSSIIKNLIHISNKISYNSPDSALPILQEALKLSRKNNYISIEADILSKYGGKLYILGEYDKALDYFQEALKIYENINNKKGIAVGFNNIGMIYNIQDRKEMAIAYHKKSISYCYEMNDSVLLSINLFNLGITYWQTGIYDTAIIYANNAITINRLVHNDKENFRIYNLKGRIYTDTKNYNDARLMFNKLIEENNQNNLWELSYAYDGMAALYYQIGDFNKSVSYGKTAYELAKKVNAKWDITTSALTLSNAYSKLFIHDSAYKYLYISKLYGDSVFNSQKENHINYVNLKNTEHRNKQLIKDKQIQQKNLESKNDLLLVTMGGLLILILLLFGVIINYIQKKKLNNRLQVQNIEIQKINKELRQLNSTKDLMFRVIAHDLLGPIGTIYSFTDLLVKRYEKLKPKETFEILEKLNVSTNQTFSLLENLLNWAKSQMGSITLHIEKNNLLHITENVMSLFINSFHNKRLKYSIDIDENIYVFMDQNIYSTILRNLIGNAIKFTPSNGEISITAIEKEGHIEIKVSDSGIGIDEADYAKLFDNKPSISTSGTEGEKGSGIGLSLCKQFVDKMGGSIWLESNKGKGTDIYFTMKS